MYISEHIIESPEIRPYAESLNLLQSYFDQPTMGSVHFTAQIGDRLQRIIADQYSVSVDRLSNDETSWLNGEPSRRLATLNNRERAEVENFISIRQRNISLHFSHCYGQTLLTQSIEPSSLSFFRTKLKDIKEWYAHFNCPFRSHIQHYVKRERHNVNQFDYLQQQYGNTLRGVHFELHRRLDHPRSWKRIQATTMFQLVEASL